MQRMAKPLSIPSLAITLLLGNQVKVSNASFGWESGDKWNSFLSSSRGWGLGGINPNRDNGWDGKNGNDKIKIKSYRISCDSDTYGSGRNYAGIVVYDGGSYPGILPGYLIMADSKQSNLNKYIKAMKDNGEGTEGMVHGYGVWKKFGESPRALIRKYGMKFAGFAYLRGKVEFDSGALNARSHSKGGWHHDVRTMVDDEKVVIAGAVEAWKKKGIAKTYYRNTLEKYICLALDVGHGSTDVFSKWSRSKKITYRSLYNCRQFS